MEQYDGSSAYLSISLEIESQLNLTTSQVKLQYTYTPI